MSVIAEFMIGQDEFALGSTMAPVPDMAIERDRILPVTKPGVPYIWATGGDFNEFEQVVRQSSLIETLTIVDRTDDSALYRIKWDTESLVQNSLRQT